MEDGAEAALMKAFKCVFTQPLCNGQNVTQGQFLKQSTNGLNSEFFFLLIWLSNQD